MAADAKHDRAFAEPTGDLQNSSDRDTVDTPVVPVSGVAESQSCDETGESGGSQEPAPVPLPPPVITPVVTDTNSLTPWRRVRIHSALRKFIMLAKPTCDSQTLIKRWGVVWVY
jgi:hypothetical protein